MHFKNRQQAGQKLAEKLAKFKNLEVVIYALPRGGVILGLEVAKFLSAPLDLLLPRKIGHQYSPEYALCAICESGVIICNEGDLKEVDQVWFEKEKAKQIGEAKRRRQKYLAGRRPIDVKNKIAIIVDDGIATGLTMRAAIADLKNRGPSQIVVAVPVSPRDTTNIIKREVDEFIALDVPLIYLGGVGAYYGEFPQVEDEEVVAMMR